MSRETIDEIMSTEQRYADQRIARYAIRNVRERMKLKYAEKCELKIESELGVGSKVYISIPFELPDSNEEK